MSRPARLTWRSAVVGLVLNALALAVLILYGAPVWMQISTGAAIGANAERLWWTTGEYVRRER